MRSDQVSQVRTNAIRGLKAGGFRSGVLVCFRDSGAFRVMLQITIRADRKHVPGGALIAAFLVRSSGYEVAGRKFPVLGLSAESVESAFSALAVNVKAERIGIVPREIRSGYSGFVLLTGTAG